MLYNFYFVTLLSVSRVMLKFLNCEIVNKARNVLKHIITVDVTVKYQLEADNSTIKEAAETVLHV